MNDNVTLLLKIKGLTPSLNPALRRIADFILINPSKIKYLKIKDLAQGCNVSESTVMRFVQTIGLNSYQDLKIIITEITSQQAKENVPEEEYVYDDISKTDSISSIITKIVHRNTKTLQDTKKLISGKEIERAVETIRNAHKIDIYGAGGSFIAAENARLRLYRIGKQCSALNDGNQQIVSASLLTKDDVAIGISNSGRTKSTVVALIKAKESGAKTICITNYDQSPITQYADIKLFSSTQDLAFFQESMTSRVAQILIVDILYAALAVKDFSASVKMIEKSSEALKTSFL
jgi:RpiR family carbohydrate utilization transcriptional regulator